MEWRRGEEMGGGGESNKAEKKEWAGEKERQEGSTEQETQSQRDEEEDEGNDGRRVNTKAEVKGKVGEVRLCMVMAAGLSIDLEREWARMQNRESVEQSRCVLHLSGGDLVDNRLIKPPPALNACHKSFIVTLVSSISPLFHFTRIATSSAFSRTMQLPRLKQAGDAFIKQAPWGATAKTMGEPSSSWRQWRSPTCPQESKWIRLWNKKCEALRILHK